MQTSEMDFDLSKENIQPLRGGRNASQLAIALQAQTNHEYQHELIQQKEEFENAIRSYVGDDPLENWYNYISWVEQSYPKHGHEGNLRALLESCLSKFEHEKQYINDRRLCKLWIKFIDYHQNPLDLYHMLYTNGIGRGCADLYKAWAYYYEVAGDFKGADLVFQRGAKELAQPFDDLMVAHQNMVYAAGQQVIKGVDKERLEEQRQALTCLRSYKHGRVVDSIRIPNSTDAGTLGAKVEPKSNVAVPVYESMDDCLTGAEAGPVSVMSIAKKDEGCKENILKPGPWTTVVNKKVPVPHRYPPVKIHVDGEDSQGEEVHFDIHRRGLVKPPDFFPITHEDYTNFKPSLIYPEPHNPIAAPKYPKALVYAEEGVEYSIEEIKARQYPYIPKAQIAQNNNANDGPIIPYCETEQAIQSILEDNSMVGAVGSGGNGAIPKSTSQKLPLRTQEIVFQQSPQHYPNECLAPNPYQSPQHIPLVFPHQDQENLQNFWQQNHQEIPQHHQEIPQPHQQIPQHLQPIAEVGFASSMTVDALWRSPNASHDSIYCGEDNGGVMQMHPRGSAMKTPIKILSDDDLAETGSRGGLDVAAVAQPLDGAIINLDEDTNSSYGEPMPYLVREQQGNNFDISSTQAFNFNLTAMKVSTPVQDRLLSPGVGRGEPESTRKQLFCEQKVLSPIMEETKILGLTSSSGSSLGNQLSRKTNQTNLTADHNSYSSNLAQNLKANAALRSSLLGEYMDCQSQDSSPITELPPLVAPTVKPTVITPLTSAPSDPFQSSLIKLLLERINFPGQHRYGYKKMVNIPKLYVKKDKIDIGEDKYIVEKILGKGTYGSVFKAIDYHTREVVALKQQKPANKWEFYICRELQARLAGHPLKEKFMDVSRGYFNDQASILVSEFSPNGSLLDVANAIKQKSGRTMKEMLCVYFCIEMLEIVNAMHQVRIIHADIKPDNFLVHLDPDSNQVTLQLIDFGCSIDMAMFPPDTTFYRRVRTEDFVCCEMHDGRPWSYHTDLFCVAATAHVLLFDKYIQMQKKDGHWSITQRFSRYWRVDCWNMFFSTLLNQQTGPAKVEPLVSMLRGVLELDDYNTEMRFLVNLLKGR